MAHVTATAKDLRELSAELAPQIAALLDVADSDLPKGTRTALAKTLKRIAFSSSEGTVLLDQACNIFAIYGLHDRAAALARVLAQVPNTDNLTWFEPLQSAICVVAYFHPDAAVRAELVAHFRAVDYTPHPNLGKGVHLRLPLRRTEEEKAQFDPAYYPIYYFAGELMHDINELALMHHFGGSLRWTRRKIDAEIAAQRAALFALPGWGA